MHPYSAADITEEERAVLEPYFTNVDGPATVLTNLPEATKAALFARYSRTQKPLKRVFLDEFHEAAMTGGAGAADAAVGADRASDLFSRVLSDYGDDSVAQLAGVHASCEQVSNLLTKHLERGRLMGYLEQSTRYVFYGDAPAGQHRYYRDPDLLQSRHADLYRAAMDGLFEAYSEIFDAVRAHLEAQVDPADRAALRATRAAALDVVRGILPAGTTSNVGIFGSPQAYEQLILRLRSEELPEARAYAELLLDELRKVIPDFLTRLDRAERGGVWVEYRQSRRTSVREAARALTAAAFTESHGRKPASGTRLLRWTPDGELDIVASALFPVSGESLETLRRRVRSLGAEEFARLFRTVSGDRLNRRHHPGREWEASEYEFEVVSDYGAFRDLQRHRMLTVEWQALGPNLGYDIPSAVEEAGMAQRWRGAVERAEQAHEVIALDHPAQAPYLLTMNHRMRYLMRMNAREAMHLIELRSSPQGHATYRRIAQDMHALIRDVAGHHHVAEAMKFVNQEDVHLGRLEAEQRAEAAAAAQADGPPQVP